MRRQPDLEVHNRNAGKPPVCDTGPCVSVDGATRIGATVGPWIKEAPRTLLINEFGPTENVVGCCVHEVWPDDNLDTAIQRIAASDSAQAAGVRESSVQVTGVYHNLLRQWAEM